MHYIKNNIYCFCFEIIEENFQCIIQKRKKKQRYMFVLYKKKYIYYLDADNVEKDNVIL